MEIRNSIPVTPELPKVLGNEQMHVYAPLASTKNAGIARFDEEFFAMAEDVVGLVRFSAALIKKLEYMHKSISADGDTDLTNGRNPKLPSDYTDLIHAVGNLYTQVVNLNSVADDHEGRIEYLETAEKEIRDDITDLENEDVKFNSDLNAFRNKYQQHEYSQNRTNEVFEEEIDINKADIGVLKNNVDNLQTAAASLQSQVSGAGRNLVVADFAAFISFMNGESAINTAAGRITINDLRTGDNLYIAATDAPDFWFEKTNNPAGYETYEYNDATYDLIAKSIGSVVGLFRGLQDKYTGGPILPDIEDGDNGKFLRVVDGLWKAMDVPRAEEARF